MIGPSGSRRSTGAVRQLNAGYQEGTVPRPWDADPSSRPVAAVNDSARFVYNLRAEDTL